MGNNDWLRDLESLGKMIRTKLVIRYFNDCCTCWLSDSLSVWSDSDTFLHQLHSGGMPLM